MANIKNFGIVGIGQEVQFGKGGAKLVQSSGTFAAKNAAGNAFVRFQIANATSAEDAVTLAQLDAALATAGADTAGLAADLANTNANVATISGRLAIAEGNTVTLQGAVSDLTDDLAQEVLDRANAVAGVQAELDATQAGAGLGTDGSYTKNASANYIATANTLADADNLIDAAVKTVELAAAAANAAAAAAQSDVDAVEGRVTTAEGKITALETANTAVFGRLDGLDANAVAQQAALNALALASGDALQNEIDARIAADAALQTQIDANAVALAGEVTRATTAEADLGVRIDGANAALAAEVLRATGVEAGIDGRLATVEASYVNKDGSVAMTGALDMAGHLVANVATPVLGTDATNKTYVDGKIASLANAFDYIGTVEGGTPEAPFEVNGLTTKHAGSYYKVTTAGVFMIGGDIENAQFFNTNDGLVFNTAGGFDKIDNTDANVLGTAGQVVVSGSVDTGFTVSIDATYTAARQAEVAAEATRATGAETALQTQIDSNAVALAGEITRATGAETALGARIDGANAALTAEVVRATGVEADLQSQIVSNAAALAAEVIRATGVEADLQSQIVSNAAALAGEVTRATTAEAGLQTQINALGAGAADRLDALEANSVTLFGDVSDLQAADVALDGRVDALELANTALNTEVANLWSNASTQQGEIDAVEAALATANAAIWTELTALDGRMDVAEADIADLFANATAQQTLIEALSDDLSNLSQDTIVSKDGQTSVHAANAQVEFATVASDAKLEVLLSDTEVRLTANTSAANADLRLVATGTGQVIIGDEGAGNIQADDGYDMSVAAGAGDTTLHLKASTVAIEGEAGETVATFVSGGTAALDLTTGDTGVTFTASGVEANVDLVFTPKGTGTINVSGARVVNVGTATAATDAVNKGQMEAAIAAAEVGHVKTLAVALDGTVGTFDIGTVKGLVTRVRVVILNAYASGSITVGGLVANDLVAATDIDETTAMVYVVETAKEYAASQMLTVTLAGADTAAGTAKVYVEYIAG